MFPPATDAVTNDGLLEGGLVMEALYIDIIEAWERLIVELAASSSANIGRGLLPQVHRLQHLW